MLTRFTLLDSSNAPISGAAGSLSWHTYRAVADGTAIAGPTITESAASGIYQFTQDPAYAGIIDATGTTSAVQYPFIPSPAALAFAAWDLLGVPKTGLTPLWITGPIDAGGSIVSAPVTELGSGLYRIDPDTSDPVSGDLDLSALCSPRIYTPMLAVGGTAPSLSVPAPASPGGIAKNQSISFTVVQGTAELLGISILVLYPDGTAESVLVPGTLTPTAAFSSTTVTPGGVGASVVVSRDAGWPLSPTLFPVATDHAGLTSGSTVWPYALVVPAPLPSVATSTVSPAQQVVSPYGSDMRTFMLQPDGTRDWDPYMLIISDPTTVLGEMVWRRLSIPRAGGVSALFYDNNAGYDLRQFLNASLSANQRNSIEIAISQEIEKDDRIQSCTAVIDPISAAGMLVATVTAVANKGGTFRFVVAIDAVTVQLLDYKQVAA